MSNARSPLEWTDLDRRAVDTARVLAMDAVQKVGNGHPGTAMSLAPAAYLLFQKVRRHDPADPEWIARDRFVRDPTVENVQAIGQMRIERQRLLCTVRSQRLHVRQSCIRQRER